MKKILWISRHYMTREQFSDLERVVGERIELICLDKTLNNMDDLKPYIKQAEVIAAVLPIELYAELLPLAGEKPVLKAISARIPLGSSSILQNGMEEKQYEFSHVCWEQILKCEIITERL